MSTTMRTHTMRGVAAVLLSLGLVAGLSAPPASALSDRVERRIFVASLVSAWQSITPTARQGVCLEYALNPGRVVATLGQSDVLTLPTWWMRAQVRKFLNARC